jgi:2-amino-4-hydroxy-6-hydroxymethyldihydropteridine diphosphokinase
MNQQHSNIMNKLRWQCRRGLLELDLLLARFLDTSYPWLPQTEQAIFTALLQSNDQELLYWFTNQKQPPPAFTAIIAHILSCTIEPEDIAYIGLGSNLNHPTQQLETAVLALKQLSNTQLLAVSRFYETAPVGMQEQPYFMNAVACLKTRLSPRSLLLALQNIEKQQGRIRTQEKNGPRTLDLDILLYSHQIINETDLTIPHPRFLERTFVLTPLLEISPNLILPDGRLIKEALTFEAS